LHADYRELLARATPGDLVYLDPPWQGVSHGSDARYVQPLELQEFVAALAELNARGIACLVSFDGRTGTRAFGEPLPEALGMHRIELHAGRSSQATLSGRDEQTVESLYLSPALASQLPPLPRELHA
jgi:DNA adenine methylase